MGHAHAEQEILSLERKALERWSSDGGPLPRWKATSVYHRIKGEWRIVHAYWSPAKES